MPKTNNHQHLKGSVPERTLLELAVKHGFDEEKLDRIKLAYEEGISGFRNLDEFNKAYGTIGEAIRTPEDYRAAIDGIVSEAVRSGQVAVEIRCSVIGQRDGEGNPVDAHKATENIIKAMEDAALVYGEDAPALGFTFLGYRGRDWKPEEVFEHARLAVEFARKYPSKRFSFDIAGPEDTGYSPAFFSDAFSLIHEYNQKVELGEIDGERIGITVHAGETPTYDNGQSGNEAIEEALAMGADRIGHGVQAVSSAKTMEILRRSSATVEICGVCNVASIPLNTEGLPVHPVQEFISLGVPVSLCTDNDAICSTNITKEYAQFLLTGHEGLMNWNTIKEIAKNGIVSSFIPEHDKQLVLKQFSERIRAIEKLVSDEREFAVKTAILKQIDATI